jgi:hypothetical protein
MRGLPHRSAWLFALALSSAAIADSITLRPKVEVPADVTKIRLRDVATLDGAEATRFADLVVAPAPSGGRPRIVNPHEVRSRLDAAGIRWDLVDFNGGRVFVQFEASDQAKTEVPQAVRSGTGPEPKQPAAALPPTEATPVANPAPVAEPVPPAVVTPPPPPAPAVAVIQANDRVTVSRELGSIAIPLTAVAIEAGSPGQAIRLQYVDRRGRRDPRTFTAVVTGAGTAMISDTTP